MNTTTTQTEAETVHKFERAGLGRAPFRFTGFSESKYQACQGAPVQPGTSCDYCGAGIMYVCAVASADGRRFKIGQDCAEKLGDAGLVRRVKLAVAADKKAKVAARIAAAVALLDCPAVAAKLAAEPHPIEWRARQGETMLDSVRWFLAHAGTTGQLKVARQVEKAAK